MSNTKPRNQNILNKLPISTLDREFNCITLGENKVASVYHFWRNLDFVFYRPVTPTFFRRDMMLCQRND